ncbi:MAG: methyltransferase domain-containing protein [Candidatus Gastranaerophilales bacterium]|nr:methyltransferase domain-containing protein [Candidatus Gastranaerophilales bacterium]
MINKIRRKIYSILGKNETNINIQITFFVKLCTFIYKYTIQPIKLIINSKKQNRYLEIGPGEKRIKNFETLNAFLINETDYIGKLGKKLPFSDESFDLIYMSHVLEHVFWHKLDFTIKEINRIIKPNGIIEIWVPDGLKIAQAFCDAENNINSDYQKDGWYRFNEQKDSCVWFNGRMFAYGDGRTSDANNHYNVHLSTFSYRYLSELLEKNGFINIEKMNNSDCRGYDHGWINLGIRAVKR